MALRMNAMFLKVLQEVLSGFLITEPNVERRNRIKRRRPGTRRIPSWSGFTCFGCHSTVYLRERERERENTSQPDNKEKKRKEKTYAWTCDVQNLKTSWVKTQSKSTNTQSTIIKHTSKMHETLLKCNENTMHEHITSNQQYPTQKFHKNLKNPKIFKNPKT